MRYAKLAVLALLSILFTSTFAMAQSATTSLRGLVKDPSGAVVPGATVNLTNTGSGQTLSTTSTDSGEYQFHQITPAKYTITTTASGFGKQIKTAELLVNQPATVNFTMAVTAEVTEVDVSSITETLNTTDASLGSSHDNAFIQAMPSETRNVPDLLALQPGVFFMNPPQNNNDSRNAADSRSGTVSGVRSDQTNMTVDGIDDNDQVNGYAFYGVLRETQDSIQEFRVITGNGNADTGRSAGAQVSMVTKSGTNTTHGGVYYYYRPTNTVSNDFFNKNGQLSEGLPNRPAKELRNIFGADFGDAIIKNKLFYFANYEGQRQAESSVEVIGVPTAAYKAGNLSYLYCPPPATQGPDGCTAPLMTNTLNQSQVTALDPLGIGPDQAMLMQYFAPLPAATGSLLGDGLNTGSYTFASPFPRTQNTSIVRLDYIFNDHHKVFVRGGYQKDVTLGVENLPGQGPSYSDVDNSKGIIAGHTWTISNSMVNDIRYSYIRQADGTVGNSPNAPFTTVRFNTNGSGSTDSAPTTELRSYTNWVPVNNIVDNFSWTKGHHTIQVGVNWRLIHQNRIGTTNSYGFATTNPFWLASSSQLGVSPTGISQPAVDPSFGSPYGVAFNNLLGVVGQISNQYNFLITSANSATLLPQGVPLARHFSANEWEGYLQDQWRALPHLTITAGVRYTLLQTPWETKGQQAQPTIDMHAWYTEREAAAQKGQIDQPDISFAPGGKYYGRPGFYPENKADFAPRFSIVYAPNDKTSVRAGAGMYYTHFGESLINSFDQSGEWGISTELTSQGGGFTTSTAPRYTDYETLPADPTNTAPTSTRTFPYTYPDFEDAAAVGIDNKIQTPYIIAYDFSVERELPGGFTIDVAYVGRFGKHLLQQIDMAQPVDYVDPQGGGDYYTAAKTMSQFVDQNYQAYAASRVGCARLNGPPCGMGQPPNIPNIQFFQDVFSYMRGFCGVGYGQNCRPTQSVYENEWAPNRATLGETTALEDMDLDCDYTSATGCASVGHTPVFYNKQFTSLFALASDGSSWYNALQVTINHPTRHGLDVDFYYTYSKSMDLGSDAERFSTVSASPSISYIANTWYPQRNRAVSDFDTRHLITADAIYALPFGRGKAFGGGVNHAVDAVLGGWQVSGTFHWTSALPFSLFSPSYNTDWQLTGNMVNNVNYKTHKQFNPSSGVYNFFGNDAAKINAGTLSGTFFRMPYPGEAGSRNELRADGNLDLDMSVSKSWSFDKYGAVKFTWETYNVTNTDRFDPFEVLASPINNSNNDLGNATGLLSTNRRMQFSMRYDF